jgi:copper(I)-binding protein
MRTPAALLLAAALALAASADAQVTADNAWMRPARAGQEQAAVYVDLASTEPLDLVAASSAAAARAALVLVEPPGADSSKHRVVAKMPVVPGAPTRLAYLGSHVRLEDLRRDLAPGERVPVELVFADAKGQRRTVSIDVLVRGLMPPREPDAAPAPRPPG